MVDHNELLSPGKELGGFRIESQLGHGNMGIIYRAIQINLNRPVALKILFNRVAADQEFVRCFFREAQAAAAFTHQNIVQAFDVGQSDEGIYYFAMELIEGGDIEDRLNEEGPYTPEEAVELIMSIADGLDYGSTLRKLTHGDIKPANIMLTKSLKPKLADLGLARMGGEIQGESEGIMLTPLYAAPEMIQGQWEVGDPRADMYSLGATLYHMITGSPPFQDEDYRNVIHMQVNNQHTKLHDWDPNIPLSISKLVDKLLEKNPDDRFDSWDSAKKAMAKSLDKAHVKESKKKKKVLHYHKSGEHHHRKKKSKAPVFGILAVAILGLIIVAMTLTKGATQNEYQALLASMENDSLEDKVFKLEDFISRQGAKAPDAAKKELQFLRNSKSSVDPFKFNLEEIKKKLKIYENQVKSGDSRTINKLANFTVETAKDLNTLLPKNMAFYVPFENSPENFARFTSSKDISTKGSPKYSTGRVGKAVYLDGDAFHYGDIPETRFSKTGNFTISFWLNPKKQTFPILGKCEIKEGQLNRGYLISLDNNKIQLSLYGDGTDNMMDVVSNKTIIPKKWTHIAVQYSNTEVSIFVNGKDFGTQTKSALTKNFACSGPFVIGFKHFSGSIDDVTIWTGKMTDTEIARVAAQNKSIGLTEAVVRFNRVVESAKSQVEKPKREKSLTAKTKSDSPDLEISSLLIELCNNPHKWDELSENIGETIKSKNLLDNPLGRVLFHRLPVAKKEFIEACRRHNVEEKLTSGKIDHPDYENLQIIKINRDTLTFSYDEPFGTIHEKFYLDEEESRMGLELTAFHALESAPEIFRESLAVSLATLILTDGEALPTLLDIISEEKFKKILRRIAMEMD